MEKVIKQKWSKVLSLLTILLGAVLLVYMIKVEDELGAVPLILIVIGIVWFFVNLYQSKK
jgi:hypothetical protein